MIYTQQGVQVRIVKAVADPVNHYLVVQAVDDSSWERERHMADLKADGGIDEIREAIRQLEQ